MKAVKFGGVHELANVRAWGKGQRPVIDVSWDDAQAYVAWLWAKTGKPYRLLSEAEWEYACCARTVSAYSFGANADDLHDHAWNRGNSGGKTQAVGEKLPNAFGLFNMQGNVWEWCEDCLNGNYSEKADELKKTGAAWTTGNCASRVLRGGSWFNEPRYLRSPFRVRQRHRAS